MFFYNTNYKLIIKKIIQKQFQKKQNFTTKKHTNYILC